MNHHRYSKSSLAKLALAHNDLERVMHLALKKSKYDIGISQTLRTVEEQKKLVAEGKSTTMKSMHLADKNGDALAVDYFGYDKNGKASWEKPVLRKIAGAIFEAAFELGVHIQWGGHWESFLDMPHIQLKVK